MAANPEAERYRKYASVMRYQVEGSRFTDIKGSVPAENRGGI
jgi:hypothetical protein